MACRGRTHHKLLLLATMFPQQRQDLGGVRGGGSPWPAFCPATCYCVGSTSFSWKNRLYSSSSFTLYSCISMFSVCNYNVKCSSTHLTTVESPFSRNLYHHAILISKGRWQNIWFPFSKRADLSPIWQQELMSVSLPLFETRPGPANDSFRYRFSLGWICN